MTEEEQLTYYHEAVGRIAGYWLGWPRGFALGFVAGLMTGFFVWFRS